jgi:hypothetical protein
MLQMCDQSIIILAAADLPSLNAARFGIKAVLGFDGVCMLM